MHPYFSYMMAQSHQEDLHRAASSARLSRGLPTRPSAIKRMFNGLAASRSRQTNTASTATTVASHAKPESA
jgi:hypothetical protein